MHDPKVSICVPSYNHARFLPMTLDSALAQTYDDFEVVVVDDGSTDDSLAIAQSYAARHPSKVRVFTHPGHRNRGISETVNLAFEKARGQFLCGLPSDDLLLPEKLEVQLGFLDKNPGLGWVYGVVKAVGETGDQRPDLGLLGRDVTGDRDPVESLILDNVVPGMTVLMRRSVVERVGPHDPALIYSDWDFWVRMMAESRAGFLDTPLVRHRVHTYNTSIGIDVDLRLRRCAEVMRALKDKSSVVGGALGRPRTRALLDLQAAFFSYSAGAVAEAAQALAAAFESDPSLGRSSAYFTGWLKDRMRDISGLARPGVTGRGFSSWVLESLPAGLDGAFMRRVAAVDFASAAVDSRESDNALTRRMAVECLKRDPRWLGDASLRSALVRSLIGSRLIKRLRRFKKAVKRPERA
jgi:glycosyltransferase involved in cell wall biosynthesis